jgi:hypothetical protein
MKKITILGIFLMLFFFIPLTQAAVIDFDHLTFDGVSVSDWDDGENYRDAPYIEDGFSLTTYYYMMGINADDGQKYFVSVHNDSWFYAGSVSFIKNYSYDTAIFTRQDGGVFNLISIDLDSLYGSLAHVEFTGVFQDGGTITQSFILDPINNKMETFSFSGFTNLVSVSWIDLESVACHHFDNIVVSSAPVPVPTTVLLLGSGLFGIVGFKRKLKNRRP